MGTHYDLDHDELLGRLAARKGSSQTFLVGVTGGIACGKSTVCHMFCQLGAPLIDFDQIARQVVTPGSQVLEQIVQHFGKDILHTDGTLNRKKLGQIVFQDPDKRILLERLTHPAIFDEFIRRVGHISWKHPDAIIQVDVPLLLELGLQFLFDRIIVVYVPQQIQIDRLIQRDGISRSQALAIIRSQMPIDEKVNAADFVIANEGSLAQTREQVESVWSSLRQIQRS